MKNIRQFKGNNSPFLQKHKMCYPNSPEPWSDLKTISPSLNNIHCVEMPKQANKKEKSTKYYLPPELMEKIVSYLDGRTLLQFKLLSKTCSAIASNVQRYNNTLWKQICLNEIPNTYLIDLLNKNFSTTLSLESFSEIEYELLYNHWIKWQSTIFNTTHIGQKNFLDHDKIVKIICNKFDVLVVLQKYKCVFSLTNSKEKVESFMIKKKITEPCPPNSLVILNPRRQTNIATESEEHDVYTTIYKYNTNICPVHPITDINHDGSRRDFDPIKLVDVDANFYVNVCCWIRGEWFEWHTYNNLSKNICTSLTERYCKDLTSTLYMSVVHGVIISRMNNNCVNIYDIYNDCCMTVKSWLDHKYIEASAAYIFMNILFVGTKNGYLLAYRLQCLDDLINLKEQNILLETQLEIGKIIKLDIMDFKHVHAIIVASVSSVLWIKII